MSKTTKEHFSKKTSEETLLHDFDAIMDEKYGKVGSPERTEFRKKAYAYCCQTDSNDI